MELELTPVPCGAAGGVTPVGAGPAPAPGAAGIDGDKPGLPTPEDVPGIEVVPVDGPAGPAVFMPGTVPEVCCMPPAGPAVLNDEPVAPVVRVAVPDAPGIAPVAVAVFCPEFQPPVCERLDGPPDER
jgi:hypothetical protein